MEMAGMTWQAIVNKAFYGNKRIQTGAPHCVECDGAANSTLITVSKVGELAWDYTNEDAYICTVANTTWVKINA
jgi:hypothetical protein